MMIIGSQSRPDLLAEAAKPVEHSIIGRARGVLDEPGL